MEITEIKIRALHYLLVVGHVTDADHSSTDHSSMVKFLLDVMGSYLAVRDKILPIQC
jgi:hypothetical protein